MTGGASEARDLWPFPPLCRIRPANSAQRGQHRAGDRFCSSQGVHVEANPIKSSCASNVLMITMFARPQRRFSNLRCNSNAGPPCLHPLARSGHERSASSDSFFVERCRSCRWTQGERQTVERKEAEERCDRERRRRAAEQRQRREERRKGGAPLLTCASLAHGEMEGWKDEGRPKATRRCSAGGSIIEWLCDARGAAGSDDRDRDGREGKRVSG